ncbi:unnamed protein product, partial [Urochloa humidicola]
VVIAVHTNAAPQQLQHNEGVSYLHNGSECQGSRLMMRAQFLYHKGNGKRSFLAEIEEPAPVHSCQYASGDGSN